METEQQLQQLALSLFLLSFNGLAAEKNTFAEESVSIPSEMIQLTTFPCHVLPLNI